MAYYINFVFENLKYDDEFYQGEISSDDGIYCEFVYDRKTKEFEIRNNSIPIEELLPLPTWWLDLKLEKNGKLNKREAKISY